MDNIKEARCPSCQFVYKVPESIIGKIIPCKNCKKKIKLTIYDEKPSTKKETKTPSAFDDSEVQMVQLILKYNFSTKEQIMGLLLQYKKFKQTNPQVNLGHFLIVNKVLTPKALKILTSLKNMTDVSEMDRYFGAIAVKNGLVTPAQIKKALKEQSIIFKKNQIVKPIGDILIESGDLKIEFRDALLRSQNRLDVKNRPYCFGEIAIKEGFVTKEQIDQALEKQYSIFQKDRVIQLLGDVLIEMGLMTRKQRNTVLIIQKQVKFQEKGIHASDSGSDENDDFDIKALWNDLEALKKAEAEDTLYDDDDFIDDDLSEKEKNDPQVKSTFDDSFTEEDDDPDSFFFDDPDDEDFFGKVKPMEKNEKQKNMETAQEKTVQPPPKPVLKEIVGKKIYGPEGYGSPVLTITSDNFEAYLCFQKDLPDGVTVDDIKTFLYQKGVTYGIADDEKIVQFMEDNEKNKINWKIAEALRPIAATDDEIKIYFETERQKKGMKTEQGTVDFKDRGELPQVAKGTILAEKKPGVKGETGFNLLGKRIDVKAGKKQILKGGKGTYLSPDRLKLFAKIDGIPFVTSHGYISVLPELTVGSDVNMKTGHINFSGAVTIKGVVESGFKVKADSLVAQGIMGGEVDVKGDILINGGIIGATIKAQGKIKAKFIKSAKIQTIEDVIVEREILDSQIQTNGECVVQNGRILSSKIQATRGIFAVEIGSPSSPACQLIIGSTGEEDNIAMLNDDIEEKKEILETKEAPLLEIRAKLDEIEEQEKKIGKIKEQISAALPSITKTITELQRKNLKAELKKVQGRVKELNNSLQASKAKEKELQEDRKKIQNQLKVFDDKQLQEIEDLKNEIQELEHKAKIVKELSQKDKSKMMVKVTGQITRGTLIRSGESKIILQDNFKNINIKEVVVPIGSSGAVEKKMAPKKNTD